MFRSIFGSFKKLVRVSGSKKRLAIKELGTVRFVDGGGDLSDMDHAKLFATQEDVEDYLDFVPIGKRREWEDDVIVVTVDVY